MAHEITGFPLVGGVVLNQSVGGLNADAVRESALRGGRVVWRPDMVLCSGHVSPEETLIVFRRAAEIGITRMTVTHPHAAQRLLRGRHRAVGAEDTGSGVAESIGYLL